MSCAAPIFRRLWLCAACLAAAADGAPAVGYPAAPTTNPPVPAAAPAVQGAYQEIPALEELARSAAQRELPVVADHQRLLVGPIQPGLRLEPCRDQIKPSVAPGVRMSGRVVIELRCEAPRAWHLYVPVRIVGTSPAVVAAHAIVTGSQLEAKDLRTELRDVVALPPGYLDDPQIAVGLTASRAISAGAVLTNQQIIGTKAVQRGQSVTLVAATDGIQVRMPGRALSDALINQRIKVENISSGKIVEGIARSSQVVEIIF